MSASFSLSHPFEICNSQYSIDVFSILTVTKRVKLLVTLNTFILMMTKRVKLLVTLNTFILRMTKRVKLLVTLLNERNYW